VGDRFLLDARGLDGLLGALRDRGYRVIGPTVRDGAVVLDELGSIEDLPSGWADEQAPGRYRLVRRGGGARFGWAVGPRSATAFLHPPRDLVSVAVRTRDGAWGPAEPPPDPPPVALVGIRPCDLAAIEVLDRVFLDPVHGDPAYARRRATAFVAVVECGVPAATCFCASVGTGPGVDDAGRADLVLTELPGEADAVYVAVAGSEEGTEVLSGLGPREASPAELAAARAVTAAASERMGRSLDVEGLHDLLLGNPEHPRWDDVAERCLTCANCTMVCPTCFCADVQDRTDLSGERAERWRVRDSCFGLGFSYVHGGSVRTSARARYRHWLTHKLAGWVDQFDVIGCVGCGRCITWCPVGIDLTEEARALRAAVGVAP
jgi:ferredoxin